MEDTCDLNNNNNNNNKLNYYLRNTLISYIILLFDFKNCTSSPSEIN